MAKRTKRPKHVLTEYYLGGKKKPPILKEEIWLDAAGEVSRYSLAYIDSSLFAGDNGRVLGYDNAHGRHHRHFMGTETSYLFKSFREVQRRFEDDVRKLRNERGK